MSSTKRMIGDLNSGVEIDSLGGGIIIREYVDGHRTGEVTLNLDEVEEFIDILKDLTGGDKDER